jgi:Ribbon-helix-helix protein
MRSPTKAVRTGTEHRVARLTILIDPTKKRIFEEICAAQDLTPSQVVRRLIRQYVIENAGGRALPEWLTGAVADHRGGERKKAAPTKAR